MLTKKIINVPIDIRSNKASILSVDNGQLKRNPCTTIRLWEDAGTVIIKTNYKIQASNGAQSVIFRISSANSDATNPIDSVILSGFIFWAGDGARIGVPIRMAPAHRNSATLSIGDDKYLIITLSLIAIKSAIVIEDLSYMQMGFDL